MSYLLPALRLLLAIAFMGAAVRPEEAAAERIAWKLQTGDRLQVTTEQTVVTNTTYTGAAVESTLSFHIESEWKVTGVADDGFELSQTITRAKVELQTPKNDPLAYDSADEKRLTGAARQLQAALQPLVGLTAKVKLSPRGEILSAELPAELSEANKSSGKDAMQAVSAETLKNQLTKALVILPEGDVDVEATWDGHSVSKLPVGEVKTAKNYKLAGIDDADNQQVARIEADGTVQVTTKGNLKVTDSRLQQTALFSFAEGIVTSSEQTVKMKTESPYRETTIVVDMAMTLKHTLKRIE